MDRIIRPAIASTGFRAIRLDRIETPGRLSYQAVRLALEAELMIADLTGANPNVLYEVGLRHASGRPSVQLIEVGEQIPFDLADIRTVLVDTKSPAGIARAMTDLSRHVAAAIGSEDRSDGRLLEQLLSEWLTDPLHSGPSGVLPLPEVVRSELFGTGIAAKPSEMHPPEWTKLDLLAAIDLLRNLKRRSSIASRDRDNSDFAIAA